MHHNNENRCADLDLFLLLVVLFLQQFFIAWHLHSSKDFVQLVACLLHVTGFHSVIILLKANLNILEIFYKGTKSNRTTSSTSALN